MINLMTNEPILSVLVFIVLGIICTTVGGVLLDFIGYNDHPIGLWSVRYLVGFFALILLSVVLGLEGEFNVVFLLAAALFIIITCIRPLIKYGETLTVTIRMWLSTFWKQPLQQCTGQIILLSVLLAQGLASLSIPTTLDAVLAYIPTAQAIVDTGSLLHPEPGKSYFSQIAPFIETQFSLGMLLAGVTLAQLLKYSLLVAGIGYIYGWLQKKYGTTTAVWGAVAITLLYPLFMNATSISLRDTHIVLELIAVLMFIDWWQHKEKAVLYAAAIMTAFAVANNYAALLTAVVLTIWLITVRTEWKQWGAFLLPLWSLVAFILFVRRTLSYSQSNPWLVSERNVIGSLNPYTLWLQLHEVTTEPERLLITVAALLALGVIGIIWLRKQQLFSAVALLSYLLMYGLFWYYLTNHYIRFIDFISLGLVLLSVIGLNQLPWRWLRLGFISTLCLYVLLRYPVQTIDQTISTLLYRAPEVSETIGFVSDTDYISKHTDCSYEIAQYIKEQSLPGTILDNWSFGYDIRYQYYTDQEQFYPLPADIPLTELATQLETAATQYLLVNGVAKQFYLDSAYYNQRISQEQTILTSAQLVYSFEQCSLYQI